MKLKFLKSCIVLCLLFAFVLFVAIEYSFPIDIIAYLSSVLNRSEINTELWLQAASLIFLWFAGLFSLLLVAKTPTKAENTKNMS